MSLSLELLLFESQKFNLADFLSTSPLLLGYGDTRNVYEYDQNIVLKVAKESEYDSGKKANSNEVNNYECLTKRYAAEILDYDKSKESSSIGPSWIMMEKAIAHKNSNEVLKKIIKLAPIGKYALEQLEYKPERIMLYFSHALDILSQNKTIADFELSNKMIKDFKGEWIEGLIEKLKICDVEAYDFHYMNWGIRKSTGEVILIDYGESKPTNV